MLHARVDFSSRVIPDALNGDAEYIAREMPKRSKELNARDTIVPLQSALDVLRSIELSEGVVSKRTRDIRCAREKEIADQMNFERRRRRLLLADAGEAIPEELQECNDVCPNPDLDERSNDENTSLPPSTFINLQ